MKRTGIIGGGFSGLMTAVQLIEQSTSAREVYLIEKEKLIGRGTAFDPYSHQHLLNVSTKKMSAFPGRPDHFLDWVMQQSDFSDKDRSLIAHSYLPRSLYGDYLSQVWEQAQQLAIKKNIQLWVIQDCVTDLDVSEDHVYLSFQNQHDLKLDQCVMATGNQNPRNVKIKHSDFYKSKYYFQNPWQKKAVDNLEGHHHPILIIGNGLSMVDTVFGLLENGFEGEIYSISPNGFNILPHRHGGLKYSKLTEELEKGLTLLKLVRLVNKHVKTVRKYGVSAEPVINSLRPYTQNIWRSLSHRERVMFMDRLRHLWGVARHRIPLHSHDKIQQLRIDGQLHICSGKLIDLKENDRAVNVVFYDKQEKENREITVSRVINCTGPDTNLMNFKNSFLKSALLKGILSQDKLKLGISADPENFKVTDFKGKPHSHLFTLGANLKGELWETTAVNEIRQQAKHLAKVLTEDSN